MNAHRIAPWHEDRENIADLIEWLAKYRRTHDHQDRELFRINHLEDAITILREPHEFSVEWLAFQAWRAEQMQRAV